MMQRETMQQAKCQIGLGAVDSNQLCVESNQLRSTQVIFSELSSQRIAHSSLPCHSESKGQLKAQGAHPLRLYEAHTPLISSLSGTTKGLGTFKSKQANVHRIQCNCIAFSTTAKAQIISSFTNYNATTIMSHDHDHDYDHQCNSASKRSSVPRYT